MQALLRSATARCALLGAMILVCSTTDAGPGEPSSGVIRGVDAETGLLSWRWEAPPLSLELVQRLPDQTRAFFEGRGFNPEAAGDVAVQCVFQTIIRNTSEQAPSNPLEVDLSQWRVHAGARMQPLKLRDDWKEEWSRHGIPESARIAFRWSLFPTRQRFQPGDYNWGMTVFGLAPGTSFDLHLVWHVKGSRKFAILRDLQCAPDSNAEVGGKGLTRISHQLLAAAPRDRTR